MRSLSAVVLTKAEIPPSPFCFAEALFRYLVAAKQRRRASQKRGVLIEMYYVYILKSKTNFSKIYIGFTCDLKKRLIEHNSEANKKNYSSRHKPWELICYIALKDKATAENFESYLKMGSGFAFMKKHFLPKGASKL